MAKQLKLAKGKEFDFEAGKGPASVYPWDEWLNGHLWLIEESDIDEKNQLLPGGTKRDYEQPTDYMPAKLKVAARRRYKVVQISRKDADGKRLGKAIIFQARDMTPDERQAEDLLRAEEAAEAKRKKLAKANATPTGAPLPVPPAPPAHS